MQNNSVCVLPVFQARLSSLQKSVCHGNASAKLVGLYLVFFDVSVC